MTLRFGTDGLRGLANAELTPELALRFGRAAAHVLGAQSWCIGRDTRVSGPMLEGAEGADVALLGVIPSPGVAFIGIEDDSCGVVVSASHNPWADNGLKLFGPGGRKLDEATELAIEARLDELDGASVHSDAEAVGSITDAPEAPQRYVEQVVAALDGRSLDGMSVVADCSHGAASPVAGDTLTRLGAEVQVLHDQPNGRNINSGVGSTDPSVLAKAVVEAGADLGLAFDGDADRLIAVDELGAVVDGDRLMCLFALDLRDRGKLANNSLVVTVMSNLGLQRAMAEAGIDVVVTPVGDRHVLEELARGGHSLGGEQSGHLIFTDLASTGDGLLAGALLTDLVKRSGKPLSSLAGDVMRRFPQVLVNVSVAEKSPNIADELANEIRAAERTVGNDGRVLLRPSGTEPLVRVMVEADNQDLADAVAQNLAGDVARRYGKHPSR